MLPGRHPLRGCLAASLSILISFNSPARAQSDWTLRESGTIEWLTGAAFGNGVWVVSGDAGIIVTSADGTSWATQASPTGQALRSVIYAGGQFVAVGQGGTILTSGNGVTWVLRNSGSPRFLSGIAYGAGRYVATGEFGTILTSTDAVTWAPANSPVSRFLQAVTYGGAGCFVAVGAGGTLVTSDDALTWSRANSNTSNFLAGIVASAGKFFAVGQAGTIIESEDGTEWLTIESGTSEWLNSIAAGDSGLVAVGVEGVVLSSGDGADWVQQTPPVLSVLSKVAFSKDGGGYLAVGEPTRNQGVIVTAPVNRGFAWGRAEYSTLETLGGVTLTLRRIGDPAGAAQVNVTVTGGTATAGDDFTDVSGPVQFGDGVTEADFFIPIVDDAKSEDLEAVRVGLANPAAGYVVHAPSSAQIVILDDEDSDIDGLPDDWEILHFGQIGAQDGDDDPDGDHNDNRRELEDATDPDDPDSARYLLAIETVGSGSARREPSLSDYLKGSRVSLIATPSAPSLFARWSGDATDTNPQTQIVMDGDKHVVAHFTVTLAEALDTVDGSLLWSSSGSGPAWAGQTAVATDGSDAAMARGGSFAQFSQLETTVHGPARLRVYWKLSGNPSDLLRLDIDGIPMSELRGEHDWEARSVVVDPGAHTIVWRYQKFTAFAGGDDAAWVDQVTLSLSFAEWQQVHFSAAQLADPAVSGADADPDGDKLSNAFERFLGLDPLRTDSPAARPQISYRESGGEFYPEVTFSRAKVLAGEAALAIEFSDDLSEGNWHALPVGEPEVLSDNGPLQIVRLTGTTPITGVARRFFRFAVAANL